MAPTEFDEALRRVLSARSATELFGSAEDSAARIYRTLAKQIHPDHAPHARVTEATRAFARLSMLWSSRTARLETSLFSYRLGAALGQDPIADYLAGAATSESDDSTVDVVLKVARRPVDNDLLRREAGMLRALWVTTAEEFWPYLPQLTDSFTGRDQGTGVERAVNVFAHTHGLVSLAAILDACPDGLDARAVAWIWRRLLVALGIAHRAGIVHGAVVPDHVLIDPDQHGLVLSQWCYASSGGEPVGALVRRYRDWYAPEIPARGRPTPGSDIYLATRCMTALLGLAAPPPLQAFARGCLLASPKARPADAWLLLTDLDDTLHRLFGPRRFTPLHLPTSIRSWPATPP